MLGVKRAALAAIGGAELVLGYLFYFQPHPAFALLGRPLLDPVIARQYGLFLISVALMYGLVSLDPAAYRRLIWIAIAQRSAELAVAVIDWRAGALPSLPFAYLAVAEAVVVGVLALCAFGGERAQTAVAARTASDVWLARALNAFGGLQLFWAILSTIFVQLGSRLLGWKLQDAYTTQQQGIALLVIGLTSLLAGSDVRRYRPFIWVPVSSQILGVANAVNELRLGTISPTVALVQWAIQALIIATLLSLASTEEREVERSAPIVSPLV